MEETITKLKAKIKIIETLCKGCGYCIDACPKKILEMASYSNQSGYHPARCIKPEDCIGCALCYQVCPEIAIEVEKL
ncbi:4Fe-4S dicluster domain-containing protein [candidate division WOR-3 bacterium]|nr:4Fe-4S dicluster domain-containing protein [candidate division WOR-3 bacterium]